MNRILEEELMENEEQVLAYSNADFSSSNKLFIKFLIENSSEKANFVLDIGCGHGSIDIELANQLEDVHILAIDGSAQMVDLAKQIVKNHNLTQRIEIKKSRLPNLNVQAKKYDIIFSKDLLHHIPEPKDFWNEIHRLANDSTSIFVMDLIRPNSIYEAKKIVESVSANEPKILQEDFYNSLLAAFSIEEIKEQIKMSKLNLQISNFGDRHFIVKNRNNL